MINYEQIPLLRFFIPFFIGVAIATQYEVGNVFVFLFAVLLVISFIGLIISNMIRNEKKSFKYKWVYGFFLNLCLLLCGLLITSQSKSLNSFSHFSKYDFNGQNCIVRLAEAPSERQNSVRVLMIVDALEINNQWIKTEGKLLNYFEKDTASLKLKYGDLLILRADFSDTKPPSNPYEFNYKKYLADNNIFHQAYTKSGTWKVLSHGHGNKAVSLAYKIRDYVLTKIEGLGIRDKEYALVSALLLGLKDNLDNDMRNEFSASGAMHVLCVSGLHVGIIYLVLNFLFGFLDKYRKGKYFKAVLVIFFIFFYALLTGFSPSVLRAVGMFSIFTIGKTLNKNTCIYNSIILSAIIIMLLDPYNITKLGFWLSYLAVIGIIILYPKFYNLYKFKNYLPDKIWSLVCVSIAAQLATAPITLYYFNQFPNYFILTNIIVVPLASLIVYAAIALVTFSFVPFLSDYIAIGLTFLLKFMNKTVHIIEGLPFSTTEDIVITQIQMYLLYLIIIVVFLYFVRSQSYYLKTAFIILAFFFLITSIHKVNIYRQELFIIYNTKKGFAADFVKGENHVFIADNNVLTDEQTINFNIRNFRLKKGLKNEFSMSTEKLQDTDSLYKNMLYARGNHVFFNGSVITFINSFSTDKIATVPFKSDFQVFNSTGLPPWKRHYIRNYISSNYIFSASLNSNEAQFIKTELAQQNIFEIKENGAFLYYFR
ncbi:MAG: ComEC/Rec2 family competence protein [Bacteroidales bacterium]|nr:ComEC/Rec2 family competence protein [Bacteroidales bacterium]